MEQVNLSSALVGQRLAKSFGGIQAVCDVSISVQPGDALGLIGPNGSGKSTLLDLLCGAQTADAGTASLSGVDITHVPVATRVAMGLSRMFQRSRVFGSLTVIENLRVPITRRQSRTPYMADELLQLVGLQDRRHEMAGSLSYGQQRLLDFAKALICAPDVVLLDEPTAGVHDRVSERIAEAMEIMMGEGVAFVVVEHNMEFAMHICNRMTALAEGRTIISGTPDEVLSHADVIDAYFGE